MRTVPEPARSWPQARGTGAEHPRFYEPILHMRGYRALGDPVEALTHPCTKKIINALFFIFQLFLRLFLVYKYFVFIRLINDLTVSGFSYVPRISGNT